MRRASLLLLAACRTPPQPVIAKEDAAKQEIFDVAPPVPEKKEEGMRAEDWEIGAGTWHFENGEASCECKTIGSVIFWKRDRPKSFDASMRVWFGEIESSAGIVFREATSVQSHDAGGDFAKSSTFYQFEWYTRGTHHDRRLSLMVKNPYWVQIVEPITREPPLEKWISFRVRANGDRIETFIDDERVFDKKDTAYVRAGRIGIHVWQPRPIRVKDFHVEVIE